MYGTCCTNREECCSCKPNPAQVASQMPAAKLSRLLALKAVQRKPVVHPRWVLDSVSKGHLQPTAPYLLAPLAAKQTISSMFTTRKTVYTTPDPHLSEPLSKRPSQSSNRRHAQPVSSRTFARPLPPQAFSKLKPRDQSHVQTPPIVKENSSSALGGPCYDTAAESRLEMTRPYAYSSKSLGVRPLDSSILSAPPSGDIKLSSSLDRQRPPRLSTATVIHLPDQKESPSVSALFERDGANWQRVYHDLGLPFLEKGGRKPRESKDLKKLSLSALRPSASTGSERHERLYLRHPISSFIRFQDSPLTSQSKPNPRPSSTKPIAAIHVRAVGLDENHKILSSQFYKLLAEVTPRIHPIGPLEATLYFPLPIRDAGAEHVRNLLETSLAVPFAVGKATSGLLARLAISGKHGYDIPSKERKGLMMKGASVCRGISSGEGQGVLSNLPVNYLPDLGPVLARKIQDVGAATFGDVIALKKALGKRLTAHELHRAISCAKGLDIAQEDKAHRPARFVTQGMLKSLLIPNSPTKLSTSPPSEPPRKLSTPPSQINPSAAKPTPAEDVSSRAKRQDTKDPPRRVSRTVVELPEFHELCKDVVRELPEDIRKELRDAYIKRHDANTARVKKDPPSVPSTLRMMQKRQNAGRKKWNRPSYSDLDPDILRALPKDIQDEIEAQRLMDLRRKAQARKSSSSISKAPMAKWLKSSKLKKPPVITREKPKAVTTEAPMIRNSVHVSSISCSGSSSRPGSEMKEGGLFRDSRPEDCDSPGENMGFVDDAVSAAVPESSVPAAPSEPDSPLSITEIDEIKLALTQMFQTRPARTAQNTVEEYLEDLVVRSGDLRRVKLTLSVMRSMIIRRCLVPIERGIRKEEILAELASVFNDILGNLQKLVLGSFGGRLTVEALS
ncbi:hypothetical protein AAMO2058_000655700 [Amorphochlora amoebiformis]